MKTYSLSLHPDLNQLDALFNWLEAIPLPDFISLQAVELVCEEVFCNIVSHAYDGYTDPQNRDINLCLQTSEEELILTFIDFGLPFEPGKESDGHVSQSLDERPIGGLGWPLIRHFMDDAQYHSLNDNNVLIITKRTKGANHGNIT